jgi:hypothetical protein
MKPPIVPPNYKNADMSPEAIDRRLRELSQIYKLGMSLRNAKWLGPINAPREDTEPTLGSRPEESAG